MKNVRKILLLSAFLFPELGFAQSYYAFTNNVGWCVEENFSLGAIMVDYVNLGDKVFSGKNYTWVRGRGSDFFLIREDTIQKKVWVILPTDSNETLLYDFTLIKGQNVILNYDFGQVTYTVDSTYQESTVGGNRLRIDMTTTDTNLVPGLSWIEGVGSTFGPMYIHDQTSLKPPASIGFCLICSYTDTAVQSYTGSCMIPCQSAWRQPCFSFISSIPSHVKEKTELNSFINAEEELTVYVNGGVIHTISVFSNDGKLIAKSTVDHQEVKIDTQNWRAGLYIVQVTLQEGNVISTKIIK